MLPRPLWGFVKPEGWSCVFRFRSEVGEKLLQLLELLAPPARASGGDRVVERFLRGIKVVHGDQSLASPVLEGRRGDRPIPVPFMLGQDEAAVGNAFDFPAEEGNRPTQRRGTNHEGVGTAGAD